ncbi:putativetRNA-splicing endonuclease subunit Sen2, partial [Rhizoctonia solani]
MSMPQGGQTKRRDNQKNRIYANPLPLVIERSTKPHSWSSHTLGLLGLASGRISNPNCEGVLDVTTPSASELVTAKRREERKIFKAARAAYLKEATAEAEAAFAANSSADIVIPTIGSASQAVRSAAKESKSTPSAPQQHEIAPLPIAVGESAEDEVVAPEDMEHLQLTLQEAFFLANYLACLRILDPQNGQYIPSRSLLFTFLSISASPFPNLPTETPRPDNPFLFNYIVYHHYRSLGWVVRGGIKFCVDYMLYKRGPVFSHAEFALVVIPVYENPADKDTSPFQLQNTDPFSWSWLSTLNRINTQVKKTLILAYVTIPPVETTSPDILRGPECFQLYSIREVVIRRFVPARMRD